MQHALNMLCPTSLLIARDQQLDQCARDAQSTVVPLITYLPACQPKLCRMRKGKATLTGTARHPAHSCHFLTTWRNSRGCVSNKVCKKAAVSVAFPCAYHTNFGLHARRSKSYIQAWLCTYSCMSLARIGGQQSDGKAFARSCLDVLFMPLTTHVILLADLQTLDMTLKSIPTAIWRLATGRNWR